MMNKTLGLVLLFLVVLVAISWNNPYAVIDTQKLTDSDFVSVSNVGENSQNLEQDCQCPDGWICETDPYTGHQTCVEDPDFIPPHPHPVPPECQEHTLDFLLCRHVCTRTYAACIDFTGDVEGCQTQRDICYQNCEVACTCYDDADSEYDSCMDQCYAAGGDFDSCYPGCRDLEICLVEWCVWGDGGIPTFRETIEGDDLTVPDCSLDGGVVGASAGDYPSDNKDVYVRSEPLESTTSSSTASSSNGGEGFVCPPDHYGVPDGSGGYICIPYDSGSNPPDECEPYSDACEPWGLVCAVSGDNEGTCVECTNIGDCTDPNKPRCSSDGRCVECTAYLDCDPGYRCTDNVCVLPDSNWDWFWLWIQNPGK